MIGRGIKRGTAIVLPHKELLTIVFFLLCLIIIFMLVYNQMKVMF